MRIGLAAHARHRRPGGALEQALRELDAYSHALNIQLQAVESCSRLAKQLQVLQGRMESLGSGRQGAVMRMASRVAGGLRPSVELDGVVFLVDPVDPTASYAEVLALKRLCVVHNKPFISTLRGVRSWIFTERVLRAHGSNARTDTNTYANGVAGRIALIAHDAQKQVMERFVGKHFELLSRFDYRVATGTTGQRLNALARTRLGNRDIEWTSCVQSGPLGGDAQIAEMVLSGDCQVVLFFEDPNVARQHEADIQLLDRAVCSMGEGCMVWHSAATASRWAQSLTLG